MTSRSEHRPIQAFAIGESGKPMSLRLSSRQQKARTHSGPVCETQRLGSSQSGRRRLSSPSRTPRRPLESHACSDRKRQRIAVDARRDRIIALARIALINCLKTPDTSNSELVASEMLAERSSLRDTCAGDFLALRFELSELLRRKNPFRVGQECLTAFPGAAGRNGSQSVALQGALSTIAIATATPTLTTHAHNTATGSSD